MIDNIHFVDIETDSVEINKITKVHVVCVQGPQHTDPVHMSLQQFKDYVAQHPDANWIGHNAIWFDYPVLMEKFGVPLKRESLYDTLVITRLWVPKDKLLEQDFAKNKLNPKYLAPTLVGSYSLQAWGQRLGFHKAEYTGGWETLTEDMLQYCIQDVRVLKKLYDTVASSDTVPPLKALMLERDFALEASQMERNGFRFDVAGASNLWADLVAKKQTLLEELRALVPPTVETLKSRYYMGPDGTLYDTVKAAMATGLTRKQVVDGPFKTRTHLFNPASRIQVGDYLLSVGWRPKQFTDTGRPVVDEGVLDSIPVPAAKKLSEYFILEKRIGQIAGGNEAWLKLVSPAGRIHGRINTNGAVSGRCTHSSPNVAQVPRVGSFLGAECRSLFQADEGWVLVGADAASLELRCLAHYLAPLDGGEFARIVTTGDIHTANQRAFGLPDGREYRQLAKNGIYCLIYGGGDHKLGITLFPELESNEMAATRQGREARRKFVEANPAYGRLVDGVTSAANARGYLKGLDGRYLYIRSTHAALNTLLQSAGALIVKYATIRQSYRLLELGVPNRMVAHVHDEVQRTCPADMANAVGTAFVDGIADAATFFGFRCPLAAEYKVGLNWKETH